jgi:AraC family transcriptional regulator
VALEASYNSHEAFTARFEFGVTPETLRAQGTHSQTSTLWSLVPCPNQPKTKLENPRLVDGKPCWWQASASVLRTIRHAGPVAALCALSRNIPGQVGRGYGVLYNGDDSGNIDYMCGVEMKDFPTFRRAFQPAHPGAILRGVSAP